MAESADVVVVGAGVVGLAAARALALLGREVFVVEGADTIGSGVSSRSSEVIHAGIYYPPGSLKAKLCRSGRDFLYDYCIDRAVPHARCGKLIVASSPAQGLQLQALRVNAEANGVEDLEWIDAPTLTALEPEISGSCALLSPSTGIIDSHSLMVSFVADIEAAGGSVVLRAPFISGKILDDGFELEVGPDEPFCLKARTLVNAAGLSAQAVALLLQGFPPEAVPPLRLAIGHYYSYTGRNPLRRLVYPMPEDGGLGVHATFDLGGQLRFGPDVRWIDQLAYNFDESARDAFIAAIQIYFPKIDVTRLQPGYTGVRPKLSGPGQPAADFRIDGPKQHGVPGLMNLFGIESPGLTASLAIGSLVADFLAAGV